MRFQPWAPAVQPFTPAGATPKASPPGSRTGQPIVLSPSSNSLGHPESPGPDQLAPPPNQKKRNSP
eukprot:3265867-Pyramimonas_sp.AAC.1